jgi:hypothetical protein
VRFASSAITEISILHDIRKFLTGERTYGELVMRHKSRMSSQFKHNSRVDVVKALRAGNRIFEFHGIRIGLAYIEALCVPCSEELHAVLPESAEEFPRDIAPACLHHLV